VSLRVRINLLITALMVLFALAVGKIIVDDTRNSIREEIEAGTKVTVQMLSAVVYASRVAVTPRRFVLSFLEQLGHVRANHLRLRDTVTNEIVYESPPATYKAGRDAPDWYAKLVVPPIATIHIDLPGARIEIVPDASRAALDAWDDLKKLLALAGVFFIAINALVFWFVSRSMQPMRRIQQGLAEMENGKLDARLPEFRLPEFRRIGEAFNRMTAALQDAVATKLRAQAAEAELKQTRELANLVRAKIDDERRGIAQELHDELAQCVTAIRTIAESIVQRSAAAMPEVRSEAQSIKEIATRIYDGMHAIVRRLRPPELDAIGLADTLKASVRAWAARNPAIRFELDLDGDVAGLGESVNTAVYRLVHEALTNVARHADASHVLVRIARVDDHALMVCVHDNGHGQVGLETSAVGFGLVGMRERVDALGGDFRVEGRPGVGTEVRAVIPLALA
jgi:two-component system sensor histidine kinase UhpB